MVFLFKVWIPNYEKDVESVQLLIYWIRGARKAQEWKRLSEEDYFSYKEEIAELLGLKSEHDTARGSVFHSYELYQFGQTLFLYDKMSYNNQAA